MTLFHTSEEALIEQVKLLDRLEQVTETLHQANKNPRWKMFKFDPARGKGIHMNCIEETQAAIACEQQNLLGTLLRSKDAELDFVEFLTKRGWDVKTPHVYALDGKNIFDCKEFFDSVKYKLLCKSDLPILQKPHVIINISLLDESALNVLYKEMAICLTKDELLRILVVHAYDSTKSMRTNQLLHFIGY